MKTNKETHPKKKQREMTKGWIVSTFMTGCFLMTLISYQWIASEIKEEKIYQDLTLSLKEDVTIEYGKSYQVKDFIAYSNGKIQEENQTIDTTSLGKQNITVTLTDETVTKEVTLSLTVVDQNAPQITLQEETVTLNTQQSYDPKANVLAVVDNVDGPLPYQSPDMITDEMRGFYTIEGSWDNQKSGVYLMVVKAIDQQGNVSETPFQIKVKPKVVKVVSKLYFSANTVNHTTGNTIITEIARSLNGSPYQAGGNDPSGFDCSGFVQYVYGKAGISLSRSSGTQAKEGSPVSITDMAPGDIIAWQNKNGIVTHVAIYLGNNQMIHAINPQDGVTMSDITNWQQYSGTSIQTIRHI